MQRRALGDVDATWHAHLEDVPTGPMLLVANEFFDALPVRQFEKTAHGWAERIVGLEDDGETLRFALAPGVTPYASLLADAPAGARRKSPKPAVPSPPRSARDCATMAAGH